MFSRCKEKNQINRFLIYFISHFRFLPHLIWTIIFATHFWKQWPISLIILFICVLRPLAHGQSARICLILSVSELLFIIFYEFMHTDIFFCHDFWQKQLWRKYAFCGQIFCQKTPLNSPRIHRVTCSGVQRQKRGMAKDMCSAQVKVALIVQTLL